MAYSGNQGSTAHPQFLTHARGVTWSQGNQPGFPNEFQFINYQKNRGPPSTNDLKEYNDIYINGEVDIAKIRRGKSLIGEYQAMVPDLPFNEIYEKNVKKNMVLLGFGAMAVGILLM